MEQRGHVLAVDPDWDEDGDVGQQIEVDPSARFLVAIEIRGLGGQTRCGNGRRWRGTRCDQHQHEKHRGSRCPRDQCLLLSGKAQTAVADNRVTAHERVANQEGNRLRHVLHSAHAADRRL